MSRQKQWTGERLETFIQNESTIEHLHRYALAMELTIGKTVLDIACGEGYGSALLALKAAQVTGMDIDKATVEQAKARYQKNNLTFQTADAVKIPSADKTFDVVICFETLEHLDDHAAMLSEIKRVLKPGGLLVISTPDKKNYSDKTGYRNPFHKKELYRSEFETLLRTYFSNYNILSQQITHASLITGNNANGLTRYTGDYSAIASNPVPEPLYLLALASDNEIPAVPASIFSGDSVVEKALLLREQMVTGTITYRAGHVLLYPFKLIRRLFARK